MMRDGQSLEDGILTKRNSVLLFHDDRMLAHQPDAQAPFLSRRMDKRLREILSGLEVAWKYPEHPGRLTAIMELLERDPVPGVRVETGTAATREQLSRVHTTAYLEAIYRLRGESAWLDVDTTAVSPGSVEAAEVAAGTAIAAVEAVVSGRAESAFAAIRPPGHHAEPVRARGFCLFNNVAVAAAHARAALGCSRVLIVDWDAHHGNGTQEIFWADPDVLFFDIHRAAPFFPGSGRLEDIGAGLGEGTTVNVPVPAGAGDTAYLKAFRDILVPAAEWFQPDLILVSTGFDPHWNDLALNVSYEGFGALTGILQGLARRHCHGRLAFVLEGGYNLTSLSQGVRSVLEVLAGAEPPEPGIVGVAEVNEAAAFHLDAFVPPDESP
ncbi:acetoin utilization protein [Litchfieldella qijiaojingensis]|uniref:Acetoin utilization protein n=1 Tax=Litchfieldella qijiaojingensis TaxID=980347 RepID=A0ABQ2Z7W4_9GAMM|nr:histone deacetylase [Halomonas qijiaojingensis]GGY03990.1 acetoin utilization protein [Halomonas qijiaojingensis]